MFNPDEFDAEDETMSFQYEDVDFSFDKPHFWADWLCDVAEEEGFFPDALTYIFCSDEYLLDMNRKFLQHDYYTDIITFPIETDDEKVVSGDMFISIDRVHDNADQFGVPFFHELARVMVHGLLHLCGYGDKTEAEEIEMRRLEDFYIGKFEKLVVISKA